MKTTKFSMKKKVLASSSMLVVSAMMLSTATYAWFTMNKEVSVTGMQLKAHSEEGLLINEVASASTGTWEEVALAGQGSAISLRPASTKDLANWWHANSKKSNNEAGADANGSIDTDLTVEVATGTYYKDISISKSEGQNPTLLTDVTAAEADTNAERTVYYDDATFGTTAGTLEDGEGYYINYKYYLKSSGNDDLTVSANNLLVNVTASLIDGNTATAQNLDSSLRVGVKIDDQFKVFAPVTNFDPLYYVTNNAAGSAYTAMSSSGADQNVFAGNTNVEFNTSAAIVIPKVTGDDTNHEGKLVDVYVWFEGEDSHCKSDNLLATLNGYNIDIKFIDNDI